MQKGDVLGHEFCGVVESAGPGVKKFKAGERVVASFPIACGDCFNCKRQMTSHCERTNANTIENVLYGKRTSGKSCHSLGVRSKAYSYQGFSGIATLLAALPEVSRNTSVCHMRT